MGSSILGGYTIPDGTGKPVVHEDLDLLVEQMSQGDVIAFASATERTTKFAALGYSPKTGALSYLIDVARYEKYSGTAWVPAAGGGYVTHEEVTTGSVGSASTTEVLVKSLTWTAVAGLRYRYEVSGVWFGNNVGDQLGLRVRYAAGASVTSAGTQAGGDTAYDITSALKYVPLPLNRWTPSNLSGQYTIGLFLRRTSGAGTVSIEAAATNQFLHELTAFLA